MMNGTVPEEKLVYLIPQAGLHNGINLGDL